MQPYKCIIIDDDEFIRKSLADKLQQFFPDLHLVANCSEPNEGLTAIMQHHPDLVFLDIEMPVMSGFEMLNKIPEIFFEIIFITSYGHYAIKAIRYSALDYLLKPIDTDELKSAITRFIEKRKSLTDQKAAVENFIQNIQKQNAGDYKLAISTTEGTLFLPATNIIRLEAEGSYTRFIPLKGKQILASRTLKDFADLLDDQQFIRVHKSHVVNKNFIRSITNQRKLLMEDNSVVDVSRRKWEQVKQLLIA